MSSSLGSRSIVVVRQAGWLAGRQMKCLQFTIVLKFDIFNSNAHLSCLNGFMASIALYQLINSQY